MREAFKRMSKVDRIIYILVVSVIVVASVIIWRQIMRVKEVQEPLIVEERASTTVPEEVIEDIPKEAVVEKLPRYGFTEDEVYLLAQLLCGDANVDGDGEYDFAFQEQINGHEAAKVLTVVMNRVESPLFPNTVKEVVLDHNSKFYQFDVMPANAEKTPSSRAIALVGLWCTLYDQHDEDILVCPSDHLYFTGDGVTNTTSTHW